MAHTWRQWGRPYRWGAVCRATGTIWRPSGFAPPLAVALCREARWAIGPAAARSQTLQLISGHAEHGARLALRPCRANGRLRLFELLVLGAHIAGLTFRPFILSPSSCVVDLRVCVELGVFQPLRPPRGGHRARYGWLDYCGSGEPVFLLALLRRGTVGRGICPSLCPETASDSSKGDVCPGRQTPGPGVLPPRCEALSTCSGATRRAPVDMPSPRAFCGWLRLASSGSPWPRQVACSHRMASS